MVRRSSVRVGPKAASASLCEAIATRLLFSREYRLTCKWQFDRVLTSRTVQVRQACVRVYSVPNDETSARLGLIVGKRQLRRAVDRNQVKRVLRETFRLRRAIIPAVDIVVQLIASPPDGHLSDRVNAMWALFVATIGEENDQRPLE